MKAMDSARWLGANRSDTRGIARICNDATGSKARFHVSISPGCSTRPAAQQPRLHFLAALFDQALRKPEDWGRLGQVPLAYRGARDAAYAGAGVNHMPIYLARAEANAFEVIARL